MTHLGEHQHVLDQKVFDVGAIVKFSAHRYGRILSRSEYFKALPGGAVRENHLPVLTMDGETKLVNPSTVLIVEDTGKELETLDFQIRLVKEFLVTRYD